jgi:hypothetical protein
MLSEKISVDLSTNPTSATEPIHAHAVEQIIPSAFLGYGRGLLRSYTLAGKRAFNRRSFGELLE